LAPLSFQQLTDQVYYSVYQCEEGGFKPNLSDRTRDPLSSRGFALASGCCFSPKNGAQIDDGGPDTDRLRAIHFLLTGTAGTFLRVVFGDALVPSEDAWSKEINNLTQFSSFNSLRDRRAMSVQIPVLFIFQQTEVHG
jgi:hypothetical protein